MSTATQFRHPLGSGYTRTQRHNDLYPGVGYHLGEDWANGTTGGSVMAAANGVVVYAGFHTNSNGSPGFGNLVTIRHTLPNGAIVHTYYAHLNSINISNGTTVSIGQQIGTVGNTGFSTGPHLHFALFVGSDAPNIPLGYSSVSDPDIRDRYSDPSIFIQEFNDTHPPGPTAGPDSLSGGSSAEFIRGLDGNDTINGNDGNDTLWGDGGNDLLYGGNNNDSIQGGLGLDSIYGGPGDDTLLGEDGNDLLSGDAGNDSIRGNDGADLISGGSGADTLYGDSGNDTILGGADADMIRGGLDNDSLVGEDGNDTLFGEDGNDTLWGGAGNDSIDGGGGTDTAIYSGSRSNYQVTSVGTNVFQIQDTRSGSPDGTDTVSGVEWFNFNGSLVAAGDLIGQQATAGPDSLSGGSSADFIRGLDGNDTINGNDGNDTLWGDGGNDLLYGGNNNDSIQGGLGLDSIYGGAGDDTLLGEDGNDLLSGDAGNDSIRGNDGADLISGGSGADTLYGDSGNDTILGGADADMIRGGLDNDSLVGEDGNDTLFGEDGNDTLWGGAGNDSIDGGGGTDTAIYSGSRSNYQITSVGSNVFQIQDTRSGSPDGTDTVSGVEWFNFNGSLVAAGDLIVAPPPGPTAGPDSLSGGSSADAIRGLAGNDTIFGNDGNDTLRGDGGNDSLYGGNNNDRLFGGNGYDVLDGGSGNDRLFGGSGRDTMTGGGGIDHFVFLAATDSAAGSKRDVITDFTPGVDKLDISALASGLTFIGTSGFSGVAGQIRVNATSGVVSVDIDGDRSADFSVLLQGAPTLSASDFIF